MVRCETGRIPVTMDTLPLAAMVIRMRPSILLFGDSITQSGFGVDGAAGWASMIANAYTRRADVLNRGYSGYNTRHALDVLTSVLSPRDSTMSCSTLFCTVFFGANDAALPGTRQHVPVEEFRANTRRIVERLRESLASAEKGGDVKDNCESVPIILITPPPVEESEWNKWCKEMGREKSSRSNDASRTYGAAVKSIGEELGCPVLDAFDLLGGNGDGYGRHLSDGLHLAGTGNVILYNGLMSVIKERYPHLVPMEYDDNRQGPTGIPMEEKLWTELC